MGTLTRNQPTPQSVARQSVAEHPVVNQSLVRQSISNPSVAKQDAASPTADANNSRATEPTDVKLTVAAPTADIMRAATLAARTADGLKASDIVAYNVSKQLYFTQVMLLISVANERQALAVARDIEQTFAKEQLLNLKSEEGRQEGQWILLDYGDLIIHIMRVEEREYMSLERLWADCPQVELNYLSATK